MHRNRRTGEFTLRYRVPRLDNTDGAVSIKAQARDAAGNAVSQTIVDASTSLRGTSPNRLTG